MSEVIYRATMYIRLSYTDEKTNESDSVGNQRTLITNFVKNHPDIEIVSEKVDDGVSGIIFDRPAFKEMMADIESGEINCVVVKDLSRLGREYIETGRYLRRIFPAYGVRFIAINDNLDTLKDSGEDLIVSVKSVINDSYCRDISVKTRSALAVKRENGDYVGACPIYGYKKADDNNNQLIVDDYPARIVRDIFRMKIDGVSAVKIAEHLNDLGVLSPLKYKKSKGLPHPKGGYADRDDARWSKTTILRILSDETYTGVLIQGRQYTPSYKLKDLLDKPEAEWKRTENAHEAIIRKHEFDLTQRILRLDTRTSPGGDNVYIFSGVLICGSCGNRMTRRTVPYKGTEYVYYFCPTTKKRGCISGARIKETALSNCILENVKAHVENVASIEDMIARSDTRRMMDALAKQYAEQIAENVKQLTQISNFKSSLYEKMISGIISKGEYKSYKASYMTEEQRLRDTIDSLTIQHEDVLSGKSERLRWLEHFKRFENLTELDRRTVVNLIHSIHVLNKTELRVTYHYQAEYDNAIALLGMEVA